MLGRNTLVGTTYTILEARSEAFNGIRVGLSPDVFLAQVIDGTVLVAHFFI